MYFRRYSSDSYESAEFHDVINYPYGEEPFSITQIDLDFSTEKSRFRKETKIIFLNLAIEFPITILVTYIVIETTIQKFKLEDKEKLSRKSDQKITDFIEN